MSRRAVLPLLLTLLMLVPLVVAQDPPIDPPFPTDRATETATATASETATASSTPSETNTLTLEPEVTETITPSETVTLTETATLTASSTATPSATGTATAEKTDIVELTDEMSFFIENATQTLQATQTAAAAVSCDSVSTWQHTFAFDSATALPAGWTRTLGTLTDTGIQIAQPGPQTNYGADVSYPLQLPSGATLTCVETGYFDHSFGNGSRSISIGADYFSCGDPGWAGPVPLTYCGAVTYTTRLDRLFWQRGSWTTATPSEVLTISAGIAGGGSLEARLQSVTLYGTGTIPPFVNPPTPNCESSANPTPTPNPTVELICFDFTIGMQGFTRSNTIFPVTSGGYYARGLGFGMVSNNASIPNNAYVSEWARLYNVPGRITRIVLDLSNGPETSTTISLRENATSPNLAPPGVLIYAGNDYMLNFPTPIADVGWMSFAIGNQTLTGRIVRSMAVYYIPDATRTPTPTQSFCPLRSDGVSVENTPGGTPCVSTATFTPTITYTPAFTPAPTCIVLSRVTATVTEGNGIAVIYNVRLRQAPSPGELVTIRHTTNSSQLSVSPIERKLDVSNWSTGRNFTIYAVDDSVYELPQTTVVISHTTSSNRAGSPYNAVPTPVCPNLIVTVNDNDPVPTATPTTTPSPTATLTPTPAPICEVILLNQSTGLFTVPQDAIARIPIVPAVATLPANTTIGVFGRASSGGALFTVVKVRSGTQFYWMPSNNVREVVQNACNLLPIQPLVRPQITIFFGGSDGTQITQQGPRPECQTRPWVEVADNSLRYPGSKNTHANNGLAVPNIETADVFVIGYSGGGDSALIFAERYVQARKQDGQVGRITGLLLLGATLTGGTGSGDLSTVWQSYLTNVLDIGTYVYVFDDDNGKFSAFWNMYNGTQYGLGYHYFLSQTPHIDNNYAVEQCIDPPGAVGTNNSRDVRDSILDWFNLQQIAY